MSIFSLQTCRPPKSPLADLKRYRSVDLYLECQCKPVEMLGRVIRIFHTNPQLPTEVLTIRLGIMHFVRSLLSRLYYLAKVVFTLSARALVPEHTQNKVVFRHWYSKYYLVPEGRNLEPGHQHCAWILIWVLGKRCVHLSVQWDSYSGTVLGRHAKTVPEYWRFSLNI